MPKKKLLEMSVTAVIAPATSADTLKLGGSRAREDPVGLKRCNIRGIVYAILQSAL